jgi:hypothetical protein
VADHMPALTIRQPIAYLAGVLAGDGCISRPARTAARGYFSLTAADEDFARAFADALLAGYGVYVRPRLTGSGYWRLQCLKERA